MKPLPVLVLLAIALAGCTAPAPSTTYTEPQLKYVLLDHYGEDRFFYCDPDYYPITRGNEREKAVEAFPSIENDTAEFAAITERTGLAPPYSDDAKLVIYREHKRLRAIPLAASAADSYTYTMALGNETGGRRVYGLIRTDGSIREERSETAILTCPICLAAQTRIDTPAGPVPVEEIRERTLVWTAGPEGVRVPVPVLRTTKTGTVPGHAVVRVRLSDGRTVTASPGHPTADGIPLGALRAGDPLDGSVVSSAEVAPYDGEFVYDLLPAGVTGQYWADGILLGSTLR
jgi:hypothetical protein